MKNVYFILFILSSCLVSMGSTASQIDAVVLDELLREIVDSSMSDLRHRLQEAVFATSFRRKILEQHGATSSSSESGSQKQLQNLLDDYIKPQKLSLALETFTQKPTTVHPVELVTADDVAISESGRLFKDDVEYSGDSSTWKFFQMPRVPAYVAITVVVMCILTFLMFVGTVIYFFTSKWKRKKNLKMDSPRGFLTRREMMMPDPLSVQGLSTCHVSPSNRHSQNFSNSRRNSVYLEPIQNQQNDRATSSIWAHP